VKSSDDWGNGLQWRFRATRRVWNREAHPKMPMLVPDVSAATPDGTFDVPAPNALLPRSAVEFSGWALFPAEATASVEVRLGEHPLGRARLCLPRPDVLDSTHIARGGVSGFSLTTDLSHWPGADGYTELRATALSVSGEELELDPVPVVVAPLPIELPTRTTVRTPPPPVLPPTEFGGPRVLVCTHQLDLGGAQIYLLDLLKELLGLGAIDPTVASAIDGPMRVQLEELGIPVLITGAAPMDDYEQHLERVGEMTAWAAERDFEGVLINTATALTFHGAEIAADLQIPAIWAIHESFEPSVLWADLDRDVRARAEAALGEASAVIFEAEATSRLYEPKVGKGRSVTLPYGLDLEPIDGRRAGFDREAARSEEDIPADAEVILCVGTIEPRKAQVALAQAFELIAKRHPHALLVFVGGRDNDETRLLGDRIDESPACRRMRLLPITPDVQRWYGIADVFVSASDIESLPRTVLEAMAWETPVLATSVFGLPELIDDGETGWLCEPRDVAALAEGMDRVLSASPERRAAVGEAARALVERRHSLPAYGRDVAGVLDRTIGGARTSSTRVAVD
jgi:glycosyltransferase involved in cell wall biosynthesis